MELISGSSGLVGVVIRSIGTLAALSTIACSSSSGEPGTPSGGNAGAPTASGTGGATFGGGPSGGVGGVGGTAPRGGAGMGGSAPSGGVGGTAPIGGVTNGAGGSAGSGNQAGTVGAAGRGGASAGGTNAGGTSAGGTSAGGTSAGGTNAGGTSTGGKSGGTAGGSSGGAMGSPGCGQANAPKSGTFMVDVEGTERKYILDVPSDYDASRPYRLVFGWHPLGGSAQQVASGGYYGLKNQAMGSAIFVAPEGLPFQGNNLGWANTNRRDLLFLEAMLTRLKADLCIDQDRIFSTGFSFGGMMSFAAGCAMGGVMRAIAPMAGNIQVSGCENGTRPVAVMGFHGDDDSVVSIDGGRQGRDKFVERNQCTTETSPVDPSWCDGLGSSNEPCSCVSYQGCTEGYPVIWCEFNGPHTPAPNSAATIWSFFSQF